MIVLKRVKPIPYSGVVIPAASLVSGLILATIILWALKGIPPVALFWNIIESFKAPSVVKDFLILSLVGIALLVSFTGAVWNIGGEGQIHMGMMIGTYIALFTALANIPILAKIVIVIAAAILGSLWAALAGVLRAYVNIDEVPITLMLNYIAYYILDILVYGPWKGKYTYGYIRTDEIPYDLWFVRIKPSTATIEAVILFVLVFAGAWFLLKNTSIGLRIRVLGSNPQILRSAGISVPLTIVIALAISGGIAGIVGAVYLLGDTHRLSYPLEEHTANYGYLGILVAWLSMLDLKAIPVAAYIVSALRNTGIMLQIAKLGGIEIMLIFIGSVLLTYTIVSVMSEYTIKIVLPTRKTSEEEAVEKKEVVKK
ncbi:ABC transporter permease [Desulfurococcaceae archaeon MEX13E-LK6-19]|nr:ABC transporter permease [Desulfurococcaceae archaeon MEX13E-LK6-19]